jgi:hypothetical protein
VSANSYTTSWDLTRVVIAQRRRWHPGYALGAKPARGGTDRRHDLRGGCQGPADRGEPRAVPVTLSDEEIRNWWAEHRRSPVTGLPTAGEVAREYAASYRSSGWVTVIHKDAEGRLIDSSFVARKIR